MKNTFTKILDASEKQFALHGVQGVSLRQIIAAAGVSQGSLHYHFGSKDGLVQALLDRCLPPITAERVARLHELLATSKQPTVRELLAVIVVPLARRAIEGGAAGKRQIQLLARLFSDNNPIYTQTSEKYFNDVNSHFAAQITAALPLLSSIQIELRLRFIMATVFAALVSLDSTPMAWQQQLHKQPIAPWQLVDELLDFLATGLSAPSANKPDC